MTQTIFESFSAPALYVAKQPVLALYAAGRTTGTVVDFGESYCRASSIYEGYSLPASEVELGFGGRDLTDYMAKILGRFVIFFISSCF